MHIHTSTPSHIGRSTGRLMRALALADGHETGTVAFCESQNWLEKAAIIDVVKAGVGGSNTSDLPFNDVVVDFLETIRPYSILSRLNRVRLVPSRTRTIAFGAGASAAVVAEMKPIPMSKVSLLGLAVEPIKIGALAVVSKELVESQARGVDEAIADDLAAAVGEADDIAFFSPSSAGSVLHEAPTAASSGSTLADVDADLQKAMELLAAAGGKLQDAVWVLSPAAAGKLALMRGAGGALAHPDIGPNGGSLSKIPAITSESAHGLIGLLDQRGILVNSDARTTITMSHNTTLQLSDTPTIAPSAPVELVSVFTTESVAFKAVLHRGWQTRAGAGAYISGGIW